MEFTQEHISVCVCTYKRPHMLGKLLARLQEQKTNQLFSYSVVVVDNDYRQSGREVAELCESQGKMRLEYHVEPVQNIALARNRAVRKAEGNYLALIDDDEFPMDEWLLLLYKAIKKYNVEGVLGPVIPHYEIEPPEWVVEGALWERERFYSGTYIDAPRYTRTSNVLLSALLFETSENLFDSRFGLTGGEDTDFFKRMMEKGSKFVWCDEACVYESIPAERLTREYFLKRALLRGVVNSQGVSLCSASAGKSALAALCYILSFPVLILLGQGVFMKVLIKACDHLGKLFAILGLKIVSERTF